MGPLYKSINYILTKVLTSTIRIDIGYFYVNGYKIYAIAYGHPNKNDDYFEYAQISLSCYKTLMLAEFNNPTKEDFNELYDKYVKNSTILLREFPSSNKNAKHQFSLDDINMDLAEMLFVKDNFIPKPNSNGVFYYNGYYVLYSTDEHNFCSMTAPLSEFDMIYIEPKIKKYIPKDCKAIYIHNHYHCSIKTMDSIIKKEYINVSLSKGMGDTIDIWIPSQTSVSALSKMIIERQFINEKKKCYIQDIAKPPCLLLSLYNNTAEYYVNEPDDLKVQDILRGANTLFCTYQEPKQLQLQK
ncbi:MAG: hypothetical protein AB7U85_05860 [Alphaproteobacteria bacterium]